MNRRFIFIIAVILIVVIYFTFLGATFAPKSSIICQRGKTKEDSPFGIHGPYSSDGESGFDNTFITKSLVDLGIKWSRVTYLELRDIACDLAENNIELCVGVHRESDDDLRKIVSRYKNLIKYWRIGNEPDFLMPEYKNNPLKYAELLKRMYKIIKAEDPDAIVKIGGLEDGNYLTQDNRGPKYIKAVLEAGGGDYFDIFAFHFFGKVGDYTDLKNSFSIYKNILKSYGYEKSFWITECATYDGKPAGGRKELPEQSEKQQAVELVKRYIYALSLGIKKLFWNLIVERHNFGGQPNSYFDHVGLVNNPLNDGQSHKKLAYYAYKKMVEVLEGSDWNSIETIQDKDSIYIYKFIKDAKSIWVAWNDNPETKQVILSDITANQVKITDAIPQYESGEDVADYNSAFKTEIKTVENENVIITLKSNPVFAEEK